MRIFLPTIGLLFVAATIPFYVLGFVGAAIVLAMYRGAQAYDKLCGQILKWAESK